MFGGGPKFGGVEREYLSREQEGLSSAPPAGPTRESLESAEERIVAEVQGRAASRRAGGTEPRSSSNPSESPRVLDVKLGAPEGANQDSLVAKLKERLSGKGLIEKILAIRNGGRGSAAGEVSEGEPRRDLPLNLRAERPPLPPQASRAEVEDEDEDVVGERILDREPDAASTIPPASSEKYDPGKTQPVPIVRSEHVFREEREAQPETEDRESPEGRIEKLESALVESRRRHVATEKEWVELSKKWQKGMNFAEMSTGRPEAIIRRELAHAEYRSAKEALVDHLWAEKKGEIAARLGKAWEEMGDDERTSAETELAEFKVREIFPRFIVGESEELQRLKLDVLAPEKQGAIRRTLRAGLNSYLRLSPKQRLVFSTLVVGGVVAATGGIGSIGGAALWGVQRAARAAVSMYAAEKVGELVEKKELAALGTEARKAEAMGALEKEFSITDLASSEKKYREIAESEAADRRKVLIAKAAAKIATGAGLNILSGYLAHGLESTAKGIGRSAERGPLAPRPEPAPAPGQPRVNVVGRVPESAPRSAVSAGETKLASRAVPAPEAVPLPKSSPEASLASRPAGGVKLSVREELSADKPPHYLAREAVPEAKPPEGWRLDFTKPAETEPPLDGRGALLAESQVQEKFGELATVHEGEGAWQAVHRQLELRLQLHPEKFGLKPEDVGDSEKIERILNAKTATILQKEGFIAPDGSTQIGIRAGDFRVRLDDNDHLVVEKAGVSAREAGTYDFQKVHAAPKVVPESSTEAASAPESVPTGGRALPEAAEQTAGAGGAPKTSGVVPESLPGHEAELSVESAATPSPESFVVRVPEHFTFREMISNEVQRHYAEAFSSLDEEGREDLMRILEKHAAAHPELFPDVKLADVHPGDTLNFQGLLGNEEFFAAKLDEVRGAMLERIVSPRELEKLSELGFTGEDFFSGKALGVIRDMKVADFLEHFRDGQGGIDHGQINHQMRFTASDGEAVTTMLRGRHIKLAKLLQNLGLDEETAHTKTVSAVLRAVERASVDGGLRP